MKGMIKCMLLVNAPNVTQQIRIGADFSFFLVSLDF